MRLREIVDEHEHRGAWPGLRELRHELRQAGHAAALRTVSNDLAALGIENPLGLAARERARGSGELPFGAA